MKVYRCKLKSRLSSWFSFKAQLLKQNEVCLLLTNPNVLKSSQKERRHLLILLSIIIENFWFFLIFRSVWARHNLYDEIAERDTGTTGMPSKFNPDNYFPNFEVDNAYTKVTVLKTEIEYKNEIS